MSAASNGALPAGSDRLTRFLGNPEDYARFECVQAANGLRLCGYMPRAPMRYRNMRAEHPMLTLVLDGRARSRLRYAGREVEVEFEAGDFTFYGGGVAITDSSWQYDRACFITLELDPSVWRGSGWSIEFGRPLRCRPRFRDEQLVPLVTALWHSARRLQPQDRLYAESLAAGVWTRLMSQPPTAPARETPAAKPMSQRQFDAAVALMRERLGESLRVVDVARALGMSADHFARRFVATAGTTPHRYLVQLRVQRARRLIESTAKPLEEIASVCGFASQAHMTATFRRALGVTPARCRRDARGRG